MSFFLYRSKTHRQVWDRPAIVSDNVISEFKLNLVKREGSALGDFSSAVEQAMQLWIYTQPGNEQSADSDDTSKEANKGQTW